MGDNRIEIGTARCPGQPRLDQRIRIAGTPRAPLRESRSQGCRSPRRPARVKQRKHGVARDVARAAGDKYWNLVGQGYSEPHRTSKVGV